MISFLLIQGPVMMPYYVMLTLKIQDLDLCSVVAQSRPTLWDPMDCGSPRSSICGIPQASILEWVAISFSRELSWLRDQTWVSCTAGRFFTIWAARKAHRVLYPILFDAVKYYIPAYLWPWPLNFPLVSDKGVMDWKNCPWHFLLILSLSFNIAFLEPISTSFLRWLSLRW